MLREGNDRRDFAVIAYVFYIVYYDARILWAALEGVKMSHKVADRLGRAEKRSQSREEESEQLLETMVWG